MAKKETAEKPKTKTAKTKSVEEKKTIKPTKVTKATKARVEDKKVEDKKASEKIEAKTKKDTAKAKKTKTPSDTGSVDFQVKNFSEKIASLSDHLKKHPHDFDSRRGLLIMVGKRRRLLNYYKKTDNESYLKLIASLKLKK